MTVRDGATRRHSWKCTLLWRAAPECAYGPPFAAALAVKGAPLPLRLLEYRNGTVETVHGQSLSCCAGRLFLYARVFSARLQRVLPWRGGTTSAKAPPTKRKRAGCSRG